MSDNNKNEIDGQVEKSEDQQAEQKTIEQVKQSLNSGDGLPNIFEIEKNYAANLEEIENNRGQS